MVTINYDEADHALFVCLSPGGEMQEDFDEAIVRIRAALTDPAARGRPLALLIVLEPGHALPDASRRAAAAKLMGGVGDNLLLAIVTQNPLFRGVLTALDWLRQKRYEDHVVSEPAAAVAWLEERRDATLHSLRACASVSRGARGGGVE